mgnify:CR=1 FL=1
MEKEEREANSEPVNLARKPQQADLQRLDFRYVSSTLFSVTVQVLVLLFESSFHQFLKFILTRYFDNYSSQSEEFIES